jgi:hypothetical protein
MVMKKKKAKTRVRGHVKTAKKPLEERLMDWEEEDEEIFSPEISEKMRAELLKQEFKLRKKQPTAWTKTKYRKFAMFAFNRKKKDETEQEKSAREKKRVAEKNRLD